MNRTAMLPLCLLALWLTACGTAESAAPAAAPNAPALRWPKSAR